MFIGGNPYYGHNFAGSIDEVRIYNRALSTTEIQADMSSAPTVTIAPLLSETEGADHA